LAGWPRTSPDRHSCSALAPGPDLRSLQVQELCERLRANDVGVEPLPLSGIDHSYLSPTPEATRKASPSAFRRTVAFVDQTIGDQTVGDKAGR
jgi:acetyl esterase/lipase